MKNFLKSAAILAGLAGVVWIGIYLYWHIRIVGAMRTLETQCVPTTTDPGYTAPGDAIMVIKDAGCRALAHLAGSLEPTKNPAFLAAASRLFVEEVKRAGKANPDAELVIKSDDAKSDLQRKCERMVLFWQANGRDLHKGWKVWSDRCAE